MVLRTLKLFDLFCGHISDTYFKHIIRKQRDSNPEPLSLQTNTQPFNQTGLWARIPLLSLKL